MSIDKIEVETSLNKIVTSFLAEKSKTMTSSNIGENVCSNLCR